MRGETKLSLVSVEKAGGSYYITAETQDGVQYALPISSDVYAIFQDPQWIGAWSPEQYLTAADLKKAFDSGAVAEGALFTFSTSDGKLDSMVEENYYENTYPWEEEPEEPSPEPEPTPAPTSEPAVPFFETHDIAINYERGDEALDIPYGAAIYLPDGSHYDRIDTVAQIVEKDRRSTGDGYVDIDLELSFAYYISLLPDFAKSAKNYVCSFTRYLCDYYTGELLLDNVDSGSQTGHSEFEYESCGRVIHVEYDYRQEWPGVGGVYAVLGKL